MKPIWKRVHLGGVALVLLLATVVWAGSIRSAGADDAQDAQQLVDKARLTVEAFLADTQTGPALKALLKKAKAVLIYPQVLRGAFIVGVSGGSGTLVAYDATAKKWGGPAFCTIGEASFGLQAGGDAAEIVLVALTDRGMTALLATSAKLGVDTGVAVGPVGVGAEAATANLSADLVSYSRAKGLYAGASFEGAVVATRGSLNKAYYGKEVSPTDILVKRTVSNAKASSLLGTVSKAAGK